MTIFFECENFVLIWTGYGDDVIGHDRKLKNELPNTNFPQITMQKELRRYLLPVFRKKYKTVRHLKKYPPKQVLNFAYLSGLKFGPPTNPKLQFKLTS